MAINRDDVILNISSGAGPSDIRRLEAVLELGLLDPEAQERFDRVTRLAATYFRMPITFVSLLDADRCWFKSRVGLTLEVVPRAVSFCEHVLRSGEPMTVNDALADARFADNPLVTGEPFIRFYAGRPLRSAEGLVLGCFALIDTAPRTLTPAEEQALADFASLAEGELRVTIALAEATVRDAERAWRARELNARETYLKNLIDHMPIGVVHLDKDLVYRVVNPAYERFVGRPAHELLGRRLQDAFPATEGLVETLLRDVLETGVPVTTRSLVFPLQQPDGTLQDTYWDLIYLRMAYGSDEEPGILAIGTEVSDRVENELLQAERIKMLEEANVHKEQFLGILSHELRTPLNAIEGFGSILDDGVVGELSDDQAGYVRKILGASGHMLALVDDLLDLSRVQAGHFQIVMADVALDAVLRQVLAEHAEVAEAKRLKLVDRLPADLPLVRADVQRIRQIAANLVTNAIKYTNIGGAIVVTATAEPGAVRVVVEDTGIGISPDEQARIFESFTQVDMTNTRNSGGVGLGLSIVRALVAAHGGQLGVESRLGVGSKFWFTLPASDASAP